jgi:DNA sulfur modification protein DndE
MQLNKIKVSEDVDQKLKQLKAKTGLTPNLLCRIGFCLSLREPGIPDPSVYDENSNREFNRYTLTGAWDSLFVALLVQRCAKDKIFIPENIEEQFRAHINRGVLLMFQRVKHLNDICRLIEETRVDLVPTTEVGEESYL